MPYHVLIDTQLNAELMAMIGDDRVLHLWQGEDTDPAVLQQVEGYFYLWPPQSRWRGHGQDAQAAHDQQLWRWC